MRVEQPTAANFYLNRFRELARQSGLDSSALKLALDVRQDSRIPASDLGRIVQAICDHTGDESMGLANEPVPRGAFYSMAKATILEPTLSKALISGSRFMQLLSSVSAPKIRLAGREAILQFQFRQHKKDKHHLFAELALMSWHRLACWLIAKNIPMVSVKFEFAEPEQINEYAYLFPGPQKFQQDWSGFSFDKQYLNEPVVRDYDSLKVFMHDNPVELFLQPKVDFSLAADLDRLLKRRFGEGTLPSIDEAADSVHVSRRTLIRRLKSEGISYQSIKDGVRQQRAFDLLQQQGLNISEIAERVGFLDAATFSRAFKAWTGMSPSAYRTQTSKAKT